MTLGNRQPKWDIYEAVILLDGYLEMLQTNVPKMQIVERISTDLRRMAVNRGIEIDEIYRNKNGVSYQIQSMASAYAGKKICVPATRLFEKAVTLYHTDKGKYLEILGEAKNMVAAKQNSKDAFLEWAASVLPPQRYKWIEENLLKVEKLAIASKLITGSIFDVVDMSTLKSISLVVRKNLFFKIKYRKIIENINNDLNIYIQYCLRSPGQVEQTDETATGTVAAEISQDTVALLGESKSKTVAPEEERNGIDVVLKQHYKYGFKCDSIRELMRFRQFADTMGIYLPEEDKELKDSILASGIVIDDKVYCKNNAMLQELQLIVNNAFSSGAGVIYYESLLENEQEWMESHVITSPEMLKKYLRDNVIGCSFSKKFMTKGGRRSEKEAVTEELKRIWGEHPLQSVDSLSGSLPYIPLGNIWRVISGNDLFVLAAEGEYLLIDRFRITGDEEKAILNYVKKSCEENGFASLNDVPLGNIEEENYELTHITIYNAIYKKVLSEKYYLNGKILTKEKSDLGVITLLKQYIKGKDECTFNEVAEKVVELTGGQNRQYAFQVLYDDMVRVERNRFVANRLVNFSIDEIDTVLAEFITDNFLAIRDVTTFAIFPLCGQRWNHYLLESFCYKYSRKYSLHIINFNDKNAGIIAEKDFNKNYNEMLAIALARADVELAPDAIGQYLFKMGYMAKSKYAMLDKIAQRALELRKER